MTFLNLYKCESLNMKDVEKLSSSLINCEINISLGKTLKFKKSKKKKKVDVHIRVSASQIFELSDDKPDSNQQIINDLTEISLVLDPEPPCKWSVADLNVEEVKVVEDKVHRTYSCTINIQAGADEMEDLEQFMEDEGYFEDEKFDWVQAVNYFIADTTIAPDYAEFSKENVTLKVK